MTECSFFVDRSKVVVLTSVPLQQLLSAFSRGLLKKNHLSFRLSVSFLNKTKEKRGETDSIVLLANEKFQRRPQIRATPRRKKNGECQGAYSSTTTRKDQKLKNDWKSPIFLAALLLTQAVPPSNLEQSCLAPKYQDQVYPICYIVITLPTYGQEYYHRLVLKGLFAEPSERFTREQCTYGAASN